MHPASLSSSTDVKKLCARFGNDLRPLAGVIHAAGVLDDGLIGDQNWDRFAKVLAPKVIGATLLHEHTKTLPLEFLHSLFVGRFGAWFARSKQLRDCQRLPRRTGVASTVARFAGTKH